MTRLWADGYDIYPSNVQMALRYTTFSSATFQSAASTPYNLGQCATGVNCTQTFETNTNETTFYFSVLLNFSTPVTNAAKSYVMTFYDGANAQCAISWNGDGSIKIYSGSSLGTLLITYTGAFVLNTWNSWQGKIVINNATGSVELRKNGATSDTYSLTNVNTRSGSGNNYANIVGVACTADDWLTDDFWMNNDDGTAPTGWPSVWRSVQQVTSGAGASTQFSPSAASFVYGNKSNLGSLAVSANTAYFLRFTATVGGTATALVLTLASGVTGHIIGAVYDATGPGTPSSPGALITGSSVVTDPSAGNVTITLSGTVTFVRGTDYYIAFLADNSLSVVSATFGSSYGLSAQSTLYSNGWPAHAVASTTGANLPAFTVSSTPFNWSLVGETLEDGDATYVYSSTVGQEDLYTLSALGLTASSIAGVEVFLVARKSDSGPRTIELQYIANGSADTSEGTLPLPNTYLYLTKFLPKDPTGASWTQANVEGASIGQKLIA